MSRKHTFRLCSIAVLSALSIVFNAYSINVTADISISFTYIISFVAGIFLGPLDGFAVGVIGDLIGCIIAPKGPYAPTVTLSSGLMGVIPWLVFRFTNKLPKYLKIALSFFCVFLICSVGINTPTWYIMYSSKTAYLEYVISRNSMQLLVVAVNCVLTCVVFTPIENALKSYGLYQVNLHQENKEKTIDNSKNQ